MKVVVVGLGKVGKTIAELLSKENHDIVVIDTRAEMVEETVNKFDVQGIVGSGVEKETLMNADVAGTDFFIACTAHDEVNIICCVLAKKFGAAHTVARIRDPEYYREMREMKTELGISHVLNPEYETAKEIEQRLKFPSATNIESFIGSKIHMVELAVGENNPLIGKTVMEIDGMNESKVLFAMIKRGDTAFIPHGDCKIEQGDLINIVSNDIEIEKFTRLTGIYKSPVKSAFIVGGGAIGYYLAQRLLKSGISVKILESKTERCTFLANELLGATVLKGDGTDHSVLDEERFYDSDSFITLTGMDEENVIVSLYAIQNGINKVVTKIDREAITKMVNLLGLDATVSPRSIVANRVLRYVRKHQDESGGNVNKLYRIYDNVEALELTPGEKFPCFDTPLKNMKIKKGVLVCGIFRNEEFILPNGNTEIKKGDRVLIVTTLPNVSDLKQIVK
ncbi:MAG: Trk system potassium transporter TrkA [Candidatus Borkfalkiaceae bacterium]|nr:Trk system potassium transporter TrkA [Christensenellaceae bacterium]